MKYSRNNQHIGTLGSMRDEVISERSQRPVQPRFMWNKSQVALMHSQAADDSQPVIMVRTILVNQSFPDPFPILGRGAELAVANLPAKEDLLPMTGSDQAISGRPFLYHMPIVILPVCISFRCYVSVIRLIVILSQNVLI